jgi:hypothetical protein
VTQTPDTSGDGGKTTSTNPTTPTGKDGGTTKPGTGGTGICADFCAKAASANCSSQSTCEADCKKQIDSSPADCKDEAEDLIKCGGTSATFDGCSSSGKPKMKGCDDETMAYLKCVQGGGGTKDGGTSTDSGTTTGGKCDQVETGDPTCDACMDSKCCGEETACVDEPTCLDFFDCIGNGGTETSCKTQYPAGYTAALGVSQCMQTSCSAQCQ